MLPSHPKMAGIATSVIHAPMAGSSVPVIQALSAGIRTAVRTRGQVLASSSTSCWISPSQSMAANIPIMVWPTELQSA